MDHVTKIRERVRERRSRVSAVAAMGDSDQNPPRIPFRADGKLFMTQIFRNAEQRRRGASEVEFFLFFLFTLKESEGKGRRVERKKKENKTKFMIFNN